MTAIERFWQTYVAAYPDQHARSYVTEQWGDSPHLADELGELILQGRKTATCSALWEWQAAGQSLPQVGHLTIVLDSQHQPLCIVETTEVCIHPYNAVDELFAYDEGEGDRSLATWRTAHWRYFTRVLAKIGLQPTLDMPLVCERFRVVYPLPDLEMGE